MGRVVFLGRLLENVGRTRARTFHTEEDVSSGGPLNINTNINDNFITGGSRQGFQRAPELKGFY